MPRYSSVQAYGDQHSSMRTVTYEQTAAAPQNRVVQPEKVVNPYGSTAGAGSGEFHVYRHARSREMERWKALTQAEQDALQDQEFQQTLEEYRKEAEERTAKKRKKRQKQKEVKLRKKNLKAAGIDIDEEQDKVVTEFVDSPAETEPINTQNQEDSDEEAPKPFVPHNESVSKRDENAYNNSNNKNVEQQPSPWSST